MIISQSSLVHFKSLKNRFESLGRMYFLDRIDCKNNIIVDCGSNIGEFYHSLKLFNKNFEYYDFEPVESEFKILEIIPLTRLKNP